MKHRTPWTLATIVWAALVSTALLADPASQLVVLLPGQTLGPGGVAGTPTIKQREPFTVEVYAVDAFGNFDFTYNGPIVGLSTGESAPTAGVRVATVVSGSGGATAIPAGSEIRLAINGEGFRDYGLAAAAT